MPRANRHFLPGHVWHLTHRCHERDFLLKFAHDRNTYLRWLFEARKRFGLCVLNYMVTSNHVHLLVKDTDQGVIARSVQLVASQTAQEYNRRKARQGAFWEDRYHATAIETDAHLHRCLVYIDLNMVRAGVVRHPGEWIHSGYHEIQQPPERYRVIDLAVLSTLCGFKQIADFQRAHHEWVEAEHGIAAAGRDDRWSESLAVGSKRFVDKVKSELGIHAKHRKVGTDAAFAGAAQHGVGRHSVCAILSYRASRRELMRYRIALHQSDEGFSVSVPGLPGCWSQGATEADALENIKDAIREYLAVIDEQLRGEKVREIEVVV